MSGHIPWTTIELNLRAARTIWVCSAGPDGQPHAAPVWFVWDRDRVWFVSGKATRKNRNLAHWPEVVLHLGDGDDVTIIHGRAEPVSDPDERAAVEPIYGGKYVDPHSGAQASVLGADDVLFRVTPSLVSAWSYGVVGTRTDWSEWSGHDDR